MLDLFRFERFEDLNVNMTEIKISFLNTLKILWEQRENAGDEHWYSLSLFLSLLSKFFYLKTFRGTERFVMG